MSSIHFQTILGPEHTIRVPEGLTLPNGPVEVTIQPVEDTRSTREKPFWQTAMPTERIKTFLDWVHLSRPSAPPLSDEALRRENLYD